MKLIAGVIVVALCATASVAQDRILRQGEEEQGSAKGYTLIPFAFYSEVLDVAVGATASYRGLFQDQVYGNLTGIASTNSSFYLLGSINDVRVPGSNRVFLTSRVLGGTFGTIRFYSGVSPDFPDERAGSNDSDVDNNLEQGGDDIDLRFEFRYLLPIGQGADEPIARIVLDDGILAEGATGARSWHPFASGRTFLEVTPFFREQKPDKGAEATTAGADFALVYDNTDFSLNPNRGSYYRGVYTRDQGELGSSAPYDVVGFEYSKYFGLGSKGSSRQRTLAFNVWTRHTLNWNDFDEDKQGQRTYHRPPFFKGATLGGLERLRGYDQNRFNDRSALVYTVEYRHTLNWNPFPDHRVPFSGNPVDWLQLVPFVEAGRVADDWNLGDFHEDMKWDGGIALRGWVNDILVRVDFAYSSEGPGVQMTIDHPF